MSDPHDHDLDSAYALKTPEDSVRFYKDWAEEYDTGFAEETGYVFPDRLARSFAAEAGAADAPILDIGAGTGLVGEALRAHGVTAEIDGLDISPEMLAVAARKGPYRATITGDLTGTLPMADDSYGAMVCAGTFTCGHVGPVCLPELMRVARPGALCAFGINTRVFDEEGFGSAFAILTARGAISPVSFRAHRFYEGKEHDHADDKGLLAVFRVTKAG